MLNSKLEARKLSQLKSVFSHPTLSDDRARWQAVVNRDIGADGQFVFAVRSTKIYCRPSCPARRPRRESVLFFSQPRTAEQAGFRPCRRCRPNHNGARNPQLEIVHQVCRAIDSACEEPLTLSSLSARVGLSRHHLLRTFKRFTGITPRQYRDARRLENFKMQLRNGHGVTEALYEAGYGSSSRLYERTNAQLGMTPLTYRRGGQGMKIGYTIVDSPLGRLMVAATHRGICFLSLGDTDRPLETALRREYSAAEIRRETTGFQDWVQSVLAHLRGNPLPLHLPVDMQATAFQWEVWKKLQSIPYGSTRTYSEIARSLGRPRATRAVARACATNRVSLVIPCHRVIRKDGDLGGYRWGLKRKEALLAMEAKGVSHHREPRSSK